MSWRRWLPDYKVPKTVEQLVRAGAIQDKTWKEDTVPHFEAIVADGSVIVLWVDHPDREKRALPDGPRYGIEIYQKERLPKTLFESDELQDTLLALRGIIEDRGGLRDV